MPCPCITAEELNQHSRFYTTRVISELPRCTTDVRSWRERTLLCFRRAEKRRRLSLLRVAGRDIPEAEFGIRNSNRLFIANLDVCSRRRNGQQVTSAIKPLRESKSSGIIPDYIFRRFVMNFLVQSGPSKDGKPKYRKESGNPDDPDDKFSNCPPSTNPCNKHSDKGRPCYPPQPVSKGPIFQPGTGIRKRKQLKTEVGNTCDIISQRRLKRA